MAHWIYFLFQTAAAISGLASLMVVRPRGMRKEAWRSLPTCVFRSSPSSIADLPEDPRRYVEFIRQSRIETQGVAGFQRRGFTANSNQSVQRISKVTKSLIREEES